MIHLAPGPTYPATRGSVWLPIITTPPADPVGVFYDLLLNDARQQRPRLEVCKVLAAGAQWKAQDIAENGYWSHRAFNGEWPNATAKRFGCNLPSEYGDGWNGCESLVAGSKDAAIMFNALAESPLHRVHLFGMNDFFKAQTHIGIAMATGGRYGWVWAIYIAQIVHALKTYVQSFDDGEQKQTSQ